MSKTIWPGEGREAVGPGTMWPLFGRWPKAPVLLALNVGAGQSASSAILDINGFGLMRGSAVAAGFASPYAEPTYLRFAGTLDEFTLYSRALALVEAQYHNQIATTNDPSGIGLLLLQPSSAVATAPSASNPPALVIVVTKKVLTNVSPAVSSGLNIASLGF